MPRRWRWGWERTTTPTPTPSYTYTVAATSLARSSALPTWHGTPIATNPFATSSATVASTFACFLDETTTLAPVCVVRTRAELKCSVRREKGGCERRRSAAARASANGGIGDGYHSVYGQVLHPPPWLSRRSPLLPFFLTFFRQALHDRPTNPKRGCGHNRDLPAQPSAAVVPAHTNLVVRHPFRNYVNFFNSDVHHAMAQGALL